MPMFSAYSLALCATVFATHLWFKAHEPKSMLPFLATILIIPTFPAYVLSCSQISLILACCLAYPSFYMLLFISIGSYRLSPFHPLANYPGPTIAKISKVWTVHKSMDGKLAHYYKMLHDQYGPIVHVGPNEISVAEKDLLPFIIGTQGMPKGPLWEGRAITPKKNRNQSNYSLIGVRDLTHHSHLRKTWNRAFSEEPLQDYQDILIQNANNLVEVLEKRFMEGSVELDIANVINLFSFDFMGDLATPALTMQIPWSVAIVQAFPWLSTSLRSFGAFAVSQAKLRASNESRKDLFYYLRSYSDVPQDSLFAFIPCEIEEAFPDSGTNIDIQKLDKMPWLNAVINETLRLQPPVPSGLQRAPAVGSKGKLVGSHYIKEGTSVLVSPYVLHRDPRYFFPHPDKY
ncbi:cytochrome p450 [Lentinula edodes]|uniref:Cytochrome p450 n=1 Tax=Lentinula edodes TaxID=5353 RepID=A0A1Q3ES63_LENED|nr:cytochrome p450 [Lentinula edodes]